MFNVFIKYIELKSKSWFGAYYTSTCYGVVSDFALCFNSSCGICSDIGINFIIPEENTFEKY